MSHRDDDGSATKLFPGIFGTIMKNFAGSIVWQGTAIDSINEGIVTLPDGERITILRESTSSMYKCHNSPLFTGTSKWFLVNPDKSRTEFDTFDDLMMKGLNQPRLDD
jgi:hypothetical protein